MSVTLGALGELKAQELASKFVAHCTSQHRRRSFPALMTETELKRFLHIRGYDMFGIDAWDILDSKGFTIARA